MTVLTIVTKRTGCSIHITQSLSGEHVDSDGADTCKLAFGAAFVLERQLDLSRYIIMYSG